VCGEDGGDGAADGLLVREGREAERGGRRQEPVDVPVEERDPAGVGAHGLDEAEAPADPRVVGSQGGPVGRDEAPVEPHDRCARIRRVRITG
jgi:hypothetical protein